MAFDLSALTGATPWGAAANAIGGALTSSLPSSATSGPAAIGPKVINVAGFGSKAEGSASQSLTAAEPDRGGAFPVVSAGAGLELPGWFLPAIGGVLALAVIGSLLRRG